MTDQRWIIVSIDGGVRAPTSFGVHIVPGSFWRRKIDRLVSGSGSTGADYAKRDIGRSGILAAYSS